MKSTRKVTALRIIHATFALYFVLCLIELYHAALTRQYGTLFWISFASLALEGFVVFILNNGDCPLIHIQRKVGDDKPFFELFLPPRLAKKAIPFFASLTILALVLILFRLP